MNIQELGRSLGDSSDRRVRWLDSREALMRKESRAHDRVFVLAMLAMGAFLGACATIAPESVLSATAPAAAEHRDASGEAGSRYVEQAAAGVERLQSWYSQSSGLYETTGWWNSANAITVLANYSQVSRSHVYLHVFANTFERAQKTARGFINEYYDDEGWWALAWIAVYDLTGNEHYLMMADSIFQDMAGGWDQTCGGGIWWSKEKKYKNAIANELFLSVSGHLAVRSRSSSERVEYLRWAAREWQWFSKSGMINSQNLINDGLDLGSCKNNQQTAWSYNQGVILGGLVELDRAAPDLALPSTAVAIAGAALTHLGDANGVLHDPCEPACGPDNVQFKGIFVRNLMALNEVFPNARFKAFADTNAQSLWNYSQGPHHEFGQVCVVRTLSCGKCGQPELGAGCFCRCRANGAAQDAMIFRFWAKPLLIRGEERGEGARGRVDE